MFYSLRRKIQGLWFDRGVRNVLEAPPVKLDRSSRVAIVSQIWHRDLYMYLVAVKSFCRFVPVGKVYVVGDRLQPEHVDLLKRHVEGIEVIDITTVDTAGFPKGGTWERLLTIIDLSRDTYVIQLDADTVTQAAPTEVLDCISRNRSFTLGTGMGREVQSVADASAVAAGIKSEHVQVLSEREMAGLPEPNLRYIRGNSAFTGFASGMHSRALARMFSDHMQAKLGRKWHEWGSEQVTSSFMIANAPDPLILPFEAYGYYQPGVDFGRLAFVHFVGTYRFSGGAYRRLARDAMNLAMSPSV